MLRLKTPNVLVKRRRQASGGGAQRRNVLERFVIFFGRDQADKVLHTNVSPVSDYLADVVTPAHVSWLYAVTT